MSAQRIESLYQYFKTKILAQKVAEKQLQQLQELIYFCWMNYPIRFSDPDLENMLESHLVPLQINPDEAGKKMLHIASTLFEVGGHTRCLINTIRNLNEYKHVVILTRQSKPIPKNIEQFFVENHIEVICLDSKWSILQKASALSNRVKQLKPNFILSFHHPDDLVPVISVSKITGIPTSLYNHADHVFSIGARFFNKQLEFRETGMLVSRTAKNITHATLQVLPLGATEVVVDKKMQKEKLAFNTYRYVVGTLTNYSKALPYNNSPSIVDQLFQLAELHTDFCFFIIGLSASQVQSLIQKKIPENLKCLGIIPDPDVYYQVMDFFIEPFPIGSGLGIIEACQYGAIPIFSKHPVSLCGTFEVFHQEVQSLFKTDVVSKPIDEQLNWYIFSNQVDSELLSANIEKKINRFHRGKVWSDNLVDNLLHEGLCQMKSDPETIEQEARFFQDYQKKNDSDLLLHILSLKNLLDRTVILKIFVNKLFRISHINKKTKGKFFHRLIYG
jgi:hypothetical protein